MSDQTPELEIFDRPPPAAGETWMHHEGLNYLILPQDVYSYRGAGLQWNHGPFVKYQSLQNAAIYLVEQTLFMDILCGGNVVTGGDEFPISEAYCRFEKVSR